MEVFHLEVASTENPVLVVDDEAGMREQWRLLLKENHLEAMLCDSYEDVARRKISSLLIKTAIVDFHFDNSEKGGAEVIRYLQAKGITNITLCTAEYWKPSVQKRAQELQVKLCPKPLPKIVIKILPSPPPSPTDGEGYQVLVIDDDPLIGITWKALREKMNIAQLHFYPNMEALIENGAERGPDLASLDFVFLDKNIEQSKYSVHEATNYLKSNKVRKIILATGEGIHRTTEFPGIDHVSRSKIPDTLEMFL